MEIKDFVRLSIEEDVKLGDHSTLSCIPKNKLGSAKLLIKENGIISGIEVAKEIFKTYDNSIEFIANLREA